MHLAANDTFKMAAMTSARRSLSVHRLPTSSLSACLKFLTHSTFVIVVSLGLYG